MTRNLLFENFKEGNLRFHIADLVLESDGYTKIHDHDFYEFFVVLKGEFCETFNGKDFIMKKKEVHLLKPEDNHYFKATGNYDKNILRNIAIEKDYYIYIKNKISTNSNIENKFMLSDLAFNSFIYKSNILLQSDNCFVNKEYIMEGAFGDIVIDSINVAYDNIKIPLWLKKCYEKMKIKENFIIGLEEFIKISGKSQEHLTRELKKYYGVTPSEYINDLRLKEASKLLRITNENIINIIYDCGFNNIPYFNRVFKEKYNITPKEYREKNREIF